MRYTVISINDSRKHYKDKINTVLTPWQKINTECVDGNSIGLDKNIQKHGFEINFKANTGHLGIWYSVLNAIESGSIVTFEDDAILSENFIEEFNGRRGELPDDTDFFSLFLPRDSDHLYNKTFDVSHRICRTYQRYGGVSMFYTEKGIEKIQWLLKRDGLCGQYDDILYEYSRTGDLNGYCSKPNYSDLVFITGTERSLVQETKIWTGGEKNGRST